METTVSRSRKKTPIYGFTTCRSEKDDKRIWHGRFRARERMRLKRYLASGMDSDHVTTHFREVSNPWDMGKDGRTRWTMQDALDLQVEIGSRHDGQDWVQVWKRCCLWK